MDKTDNIPDYLMRAARGPTIGLGEKHHALKRLEQDVLGAILARPENLVQLPTLEPRDFNDIRHAAIFAAMRSLDAAGTPIDVDTVGKALADEGKLQGIGGYDFLLLIRQEVPSVDNAIEYAKQVREESAARRLCRAMREVIAEVELKSLSGSEGISMLLERVSEIDGDQPDGAVEIFDVLKKRMKAYEQIAADRQNGIVTMSGFPTGVDKLDQKIGGVQPGIVTLVVARPAMGKSAFGGAIARASSAAGHGVHVFNLEDSEASYGDRTLSGTSKVPAQDLRTASITRDQIGAIHNAMVAIKGRRWLLDSRSGITVEEIPRSVRRHRRSNKTRVVIVDYLNLVKWPRWCKTAHEALTYNITVLADAAKLDNDAYVVFAQLNRDIEKRKDKRPQMADVRESGSLEERSKCMLGLYRGAYYGEPTEGIDWDPDWDGHDAKPSAAEFAATIQIPIIKNNNGESGGFAWANWDGPTTRVW